MCILAKTIEDTPRLLMQIYYVKETIQNFDRMFDQICITRHNMAFIIIFCLENSNIVEQNINLILN